MSSPASDGLATVANFRDVGGHETGDGRRIRTGLLYRSVALDRVSGADLETLRGLGLVAVFDLRTPHEQEQYPDRLPPGARLVTLDVLADTGEADYSSVAAHLREPERFAGSMTAQDMLDFNVATYRDLVRLPSARRAYQAFFRDLALDGSPALVHCTGGKDRTGWAVASLLLLLGVDEVTIMADYIASNEPVRELFTPIIDGFVARGGELGVVEAMLSAQPAFLRSALDTVAQDHGSIEGYFSDGLGLDASTLDGLRTGFLEPSR